MQWQRVDFDHHFRGGSGLRDLRHDDSDQGLLHLLELRHHVRIHEKLSLPPLWQHHDVGKLKRPDLSPKRCSERCLR